MEAVGCFCCDVDPERLEIVANGAASDDDDDIGSGGGGVCVVVVATTGATAIKSSFGFHDAARNKRYPLAPVYTSPTVSISGEKQASNVHNFTFSASIRSFSVIMFLTHSKSFLILSLP